MPSAQLGNQRLFTASGHLCAQPLSAHTPRTAFKKQVRGARSRLPEGLGRSAAVSDTGILLSWLEMSRFPRTGLESQRSPPTSCRSHHLPCKLDAAKEPPPLSWDFASSTDQLLGGQGAALINRGRASIAGHEIPRLGQLDWSHF